MGIIYRAYLSNGMSYIGQTIRGLHNRESDHWRLRKGKGLFQIALRYYGRDAFSWEVLEECDEKELNDKEKYWILYYDSYDYGFNSDLGGGVNYIRRHPNDVIRKKMGNGNRGKHISNEAKKNISKSSKGKPHSEEHIEKIRKTLYGNHYALGSKRTEESKQKTSDSLKRFYAAHPGYTSGEKNGMYGKHLTEEQKKKLSEAHKGKKLSEEHKQKIGEKHRGTHRSDETKKKMSEARKKYWEKRGK